MPRLLPFTDTTLPPCVPKNMGWMQCMACQDERSVEHTLCERPEAEALLDNLLGGLDAEHSSE